jgi:hypothetical protein
MLEFRGGGAWRFGKLLMDRPCYYLENSRKMNTEALFTPRAKTMQAREYVLILSSLTRR